MSEYELVSPAVEHDAVDGDWTVSWLLKSLVILDETTILMTVHSLHTHTPHTDTLTSVS